MYSTGGPLSDEFNLWPGLGQAGPPNPAFLLTLRFGSLSSTFLCGGLQPHHHSGYHRPWAGRVVSKGSWANTGLRSGGDSQSCGADDLTA